MIKNEKLYTFLACAGLLVLFHYSFKYMILRRHDEENGSLRAMRYRLKGPLSFDDPQLLAYLKTTFVPPSPKPLELHYEKDASYHKYKRSFMYLAGKHLNEFYFSNIERGFFVEAGALDGEYLSNTLALEQNQDWTGLLIEPNQEMFRKMKTKNRKAWLSNSCLAIKPYPHEATLLSKVESGNKMVLKGQSALLDSPNIHERFQNLTIKREKVQCFPVASLLLALNVTRVDYFSLDVEDAESLIIDSFPFDQILVDVWFIEHRMPNKSIYSIDVNRNDKDFIQKFTSRGYVFHRLLDYVFVRRGSKYSLSPPPKFDLPSLIKY